jgi:pimeloyl-ACP methyl ester carboxylesterase
LKHVGDQEVDRDVRSLRREEAAAPLKTCNVVRKFAAAMGGTSCTVTGYDSAHPFQSVRRSGAAGAALCLPDRGIAKLPGYRVELVEAPVFAGQVFVLEAGPIGAPAVVLLHGLGDSGARDWYSILPALAAHHRVLTFDLPGFGRSTHGHDLYSPERYADFVRALAGQRVTAPFDLIGHSMGGAIALEYAARFPDDVSRLVLIDVAGVLHRKAYVNFAIATGLDNLLGLLAAPGKELANAAMEAASTTVGSLVPGTSDPSIVLHTELLRTTILDTPTRIAALATMLDNLGPAIASVRAPSWILWGQRDRVASLRAGKLLAARLPHAQLKVLEGADHDPMSSDSAAVVSFVVQALATPVGTWPAPRVLAGPLVSERQGRCEGQQGVIFSGDYAEVDITGCQDVVLRGVRAAAIRVRDSYVIMEDTRVESQGTALRVKGSRLEITASDFIGNVALDVEGSDIDLAGVSLQGRKAAVHVGSDTKLIFSVSRIDSPNNHRYLHDVLELGVGADL